ncbi:outer membrane protein assembly factor [Betaproteobacteria bacterium]|nr:outer membrane protein assembly factor [Betaproteobacteria bacterium]
MRALLERHVRLLRVKGEEIPASAPDRSALVRRTRREVSELLMTEGYFGARVRIDRTDSIHWKLRVEPGSRARIAAVNIRFDGAFGTDEDEAGARETLRKAWLLPVDAPFRQADWDQAKQELLDALSARKYAAAKFVSALADVDPERNEVTLALVLDSGPAFHLGELEVSGLRHLPADFVARYSELEVGGVYDRRALYALQEALQSAPQLASVVVDIDPDPAHAAAVPVRVQAVEAQRYRLRFGGGVSSNTGYRVETSFRDVNLFKRGWELSSGLRLEQRRQEFYTDLFLLPTRAGHQDSVGMGIERSDLEGLKIHGQAVGGNRRTRRGAIETQTLVKVQHEAIHPDGAEKSSYNTLVANWGRVHRAVDDVLDPRRGHVLEVQLGGGMGISGVKREFVRLYGRYQHYFTVGERDVLTVRSELGATLADSRDGIPQDFLFRAGGTQSVRGYAYRSLGVKEGTATVGGRYLATASVEYVRWFRPDAGAAVFIDSGDAADSRTSFQAHTGYGVGARWKSPAGPLAIDLAWGRNERTPRLHFGVAIAF